MAKNFKQLHEKMTDEQKIKSDEIFQKALQYIESIATSRNAGFVKNTANNTRAPKNFDRMNEDEIFEMFAL